MDYYDMEQYMAKQLLARWRTPTKTKKDNKYVRVWIKGRGAVGRSRLVIELLTRRFLRKDEYVRHKNGKKWDDKPCNLVLDCGHLHHDFAGYAPKFREWVYQVARGAGKGGT